jgi:Ca2+-transporting ATPase
LSSNHTTAAEIKGLSDEEVLKQRSLHGRNTLPKGKNLFISNLLETVTEPMFILLCCTSILYFILGESTEAFTMLVALSLVASIDVLQNFRSQKAISALNRIHEGNAKVLRDGKLQVISGEDVVLGDILVCEEGTIIPADAELLLSNDFSINESILTGESVSVEKTSSEIIYQGTQVVRGYSYAKVIAIGNETSLSGIGSLIENTGKEKTPLQLKVNRFVRNMFLAGLIAFLFVWGYQWYLSKDLLHGLLHGLTIAMSVIPEEIPVALSTFMALGAYRLLKRGIIARSPKTVETLGSATVICVDKTGTLTQNLMSLQYVLDAQIGDSELANNPLPSDTLVYGMWASEVEPFDPMEQSIHRWYAQLCGTDLRKDARMIQEFPLAGSPPSMTHIFKSSEDEQIIACKGALEAVLEKCDADEAIRDQWRERATVYARKGYRVLGVAKGESIKNTPLALSDITFTFCGLLVFQDPISPDIPRVIQNFQEAGIHVKMITGDYPETATAIAAACGIPSESVLTGDEVLSMSDEVLKTKVSDVSIFARIKPELKLRIVTALQANGEIVAMTGDGVNDGPALKAAHIGIAMGKRGTDVAKSAAGLILSNDEMDRMVDAIYLGRRINLNLSRAIRYIVAIHIPIILLVILPLFLHWMPDTLFSPIHVILLELIMGPTCSLVFENETPDHGEMHVPISISKALIPKKQLFGTLLQGLSLTFACTLSAFLLHYCELGEESMRTAVFFTLIFGNVFLTLYNRSDAFTILSGKLSRNAMVYWIIGITGSFMLLIATFESLQKLLGMSAVNLQILLISLISATMGTIWIDFRKLMLTRKK